MINKVSLLTACSGSVAGALLLFIELTYSALSTDTKPPADIKSSLPVMYSSADNPEALYQKALAIFDVEDEESSSTGNTEDLLSEDVTVRIVAQAKVGDKQSTLLEIASGTETKQIKVTEGSVVNGLMIKAITDKQLIVEKDATEHSIKLFHPKELNLTKTEKANDTL